MLRDRPVRTLTARSLKIECGIVTSPCNRTPTTVVVRVGREQRDRRSPVPKTINELRASVSRARGDLRGVG